MIPTENLGSFWVLSSFCLQEVVLRKSSHAGLVPNLFSTLSFCLPSLWVIENSPYISLGKIGLSWLLCTYGHSQSLCWSHMSLLHGSPGPFKASSVVQTLYQASSVSHLVLSLRLCYPSLMKNHIFFCYLQKSQTPCKFQSLHHLHPACEFQLAALPVTHLLRDMLLITEPVALSQGPRHPEGWI